MVTLTRIFFTLGLIALLSAAAGPAGAQSAGAQGIGNRAAEEGAAKGAPAAAAAQAQKPGATRDGPPLPRFVTLRAAEVNLRTGPGVRYPIDWVYSRTGLPLEVIDEFETWRRVRDWEGSVGWVHQSMLSSDRKVMVVDKQRLLRREPEPEAAGAALLEPGVLGELKRCAGDWCEVKVRDVTGWLQRTELYGVYPDETGP